MQRRSFDLIVIGTGVAGSTVAKQCRAAGWGVAISLILRGLGFGLRSFIDTEPLNYAL